MALVQWMEAVHRAGGAVEESFQEMHMTLKLGTFKWERMFKHAEVDSREALQREYFTEAGRNETLAEDGGGK